MNRAFLKGGRHSHRSRQKKYYWEMSEFLGKHPPIGLMTRGLGAVQPAAKGSEATEEEKRWEAEGGHTDPPR